MSLGAGQHYRRVSLVKSGLAAGMRLLDVATGTGLVARAAGQILREPGAVIGLDPSGGMLRQASTPSRRLSCGAWRGRLSWPCGGGREWGGPRYTQGEWLWEAPKVRPAA
jgi:hypothetical protein